MSGWDSTQQPGLGSLPLPTGVAGLDFIPTFAALPFPHPVDPSTGAATKPQKEPTTSRTFFHASFTKILRHLSTQISGHPLMSLIDGFSPKQHRTTDTTPNTTDRSPIKANNTSTDTDTNKNAKPPPHN